MKLNTTIGIVKERHSSILAQFIQELRASNSVSKDLPEDSFKFCFSICERISGYGPVTLHDRLVNSFANLNIKAGRFQRFYPIPFPQEATDKYQEMDQERLKQEQEFNKMSPEEKQNSINEILSQLTGTPGFMQISVPRRIL